MISRSTIGEPTNCPEDFHRLLGIFHATWCSLDSVLDFLVGNLLGTKPEDAHLTLSGMMFGTKLRLARNLVYRSSHRNKAALMASLNQLQASKRDVLTHSYIASDNENVMFIERTRGGDYQTKEHHFTADQFREHVAALIRAAQAFQAATDASDFEILEFARAALRASSKA